MYQSTFVHSDLGNPLQFSGNVSEPRSNLESLTFQVALFSMVLPAVQITQLQMTGLLWGGGGGEVKCILVQAMKLCTGRMAHRGSRGIALPIHDHSTRSG